MKILCTAQMGTGTIMGQTMRVVAIAKALQRRGHTIRFLAAGKLIPIIKNFGIDVIEASDMPQNEAYADPQAASAMPKEELIAKIQDFMAKMVQLETEAAKRECPNLIVSGTLTGSLVARQLDIPSVMAFLQPHGEKTLTMFKSRMQDHGEQEIKKVIEKILGMMEAADIIVLEGMPEISGGVTLERFGETLKTIKEKIRFAGPLLAEYPAQLPERNELKKMYSGDEKKPLVYITIGGGSVLIGEQFLKIVLDALRMLPAVIGVISTGIAISPEAIEQYDPPRNALIRGFVPGTEMIKASDVTVFHGGSSTLMACIACGTPAVVVPSMGEQEDNGAVLSQFGAGIVLDKQTLTPEILAEAIQKINVSGDYRIGAQRLKLLGEKYGGTEAVADWAEQLMKGSGK